MARFDPRRPMVLETPVAAPDGAGGQAIAWQALGTLWLDLRPGAGRERLGPAETRGEMRFRAFLRAAPQGSPQRPRPGQRLRDGGRHLRVLAVAEADPAGLWLVAALAEEVAA